MGKKVLQTHYQLATAKQQDTCLIFLKLSQVYDYLWIGVALVPVCMGISFERPLPVENYIIPNKVSTADKQIIISICFIK
jgi:hypothetical protein